MVVKRLFSLLVLILTVSITINPVLAQHGPEGHETAAEHGHEAAEEKKGFNASEVIFGHIRDSHYWHLFDLNGHPVSLPLPVIIYHPEKGLEMFSASRFHHGHESYNGYYIDHNVKMKEKIASEDGAAIKDFSITKNVLSMFLSVAILLILMTNVAKKYKKNGSMKAPSGFQNALEPVYYLHSRRGGQTQPGQQVHGIYAPAAYGVLFPVAEQHAGAVARRRQLYR